MENKNKTSIKKGSYNFEANNIPDEDIIYIWFKNERMAINTMELILKQLKETDRTQNLCIHFPGKLSFEEE